jgi:hypothetical protein
MRMGADLRERLFGKGLSLMGDVAEFRFQVTSGSGKA